MWSEYHKFRTVYLWDLIETGVDFSGPEFDWEQLRQRVCRDTYEELSALFLDAFSVEQQTLDKSNYFLLFFWGVFIWDEEIPFDTRFRVAQDIVTLGGLIRLDNRSKAKETRTEKRIDNRQELPGSSSGSNEFSGPEMARWYLLGGLDALAFFLQHVESPTHITCTGRHVDGHIELVTAAMNLGKHCPKFFLKSIGFPANLALGVFESAIVPYALGLNLILDPGYLRLFFQPSLLDSCFGTGTSLLSLVCLLDEDDPEVRQRVAFSCLSLLKQSASAANPLYLFERMSPVEGSVLAIVDMIVQNTTFSSAGSAITIFVRRLYDDGERKNANNLIRTTCASLLEKGNVRKSKSLERFIALILDIKTNSRTRLAVALVALTAGYSEQARVLSEGLSKTDRTAFDNFARLGKIPKLRSDDSEKSLMLSSLVLADYEFATELHYTILDEQESLFPGFEVNTDEIIPSLEYNLPPRELYIQTLTKNDEDRVLALREALDKHPYEFSLYLALTDEYFSLEKPHTCGEVLQTAILKINELIDETGLDAFRIECSRHHNRPILKVFREFADFLRFSKRDLVSAIAMFEFLLTVDPLDMMRAKNGLLNCYLRAKNFIRAKEFLDEYSYDTSLDFVMARAYLAFINRDIDEARLELMSAVQMNPLVLEYLLEDFDPDEYDEAEDESIRREAILYALEYRRFWESNVKAIRWLKTQHI